MPKPLPPPLQTLKRSFLPRRWTSRIRLLTGRKPSMYLPQGILKVAVQFPLSLWHGQQDDVYLYIHLTQRGESGTFVLKRVSFTLLSTTRISNNAAAENKIGRILIEPGQSTQHNDGTAVFYTKLGLHHFTESKSYLPDFSSSAPFIEHRHQILTEAVLGAPGTDHNLSFDCTGQRIQDGLVY